MWTHLPHLCHGPVKVLSWPKIWTLWCRWCSGMLYGQFLSNKTPQTLQILAVQLNVIMSRPLHPQRLHSFRAAFKQGQPVREVYHLVFCAVDDQYRRADFGNFFNTKKKKKTKIKEIITLIHLCPLKAHTVLQEMELMYGPVTKACHWACHKTVSLPRVSNKH